MVKRDDDIKSHIKNNEREAKKAETNKKMCIEEEDLYKRIHMMMYIVLLVDIYVI